MNRKDMKLWISVIIVLATAGLDAILQASDRAIHIGWFIPVWVFELGAFISVVRQIFKLKKEHEQEKKDILGTE